MTYHFHNRHSTPLRECFFINRPMEVKKIMDTNELRSLQEAYLEVVGSQQLDEGYVEFDKVRGPRKPSPRGKLVTKASEKRLGNILSPHHRDAKKQGERV